MIHNIAIKKTIDNTILINIELGIEKLNVNNIPTTKIIICKISNT